MRVLLDESVPRQLAAHLRDHPVVTVPQMGWAGIQNGELLRRAAERFDVLITGDQSLEYQQDLRGLRLAIIVVSGRNNRVETFLSLSGRILEAIGSAVPGTITRVFDPTR